MQDKSCGKESRLDIGYADGRSGKYKMRVRKIAEKPEKKKSNELYGKNLIGKNCTVKFGWRSDSKAEEMVVVDYDDVTKSYSCYDPVKKRIVEFKDVKIQKEQEEFGRKQICVAEMRRSVELSLVDTTRKELKNNYKGFQYALY
jgi:hypothetical protein